MRTRLATADAVMMMMMVMMLLLLLLRLLLLYAQLGRVCGLLLLDALLAHRTPRAEHNRHQRHQEEAAVGQQEALERRHRR